MDLNITLEDLSEGLAKSRQANGTCPSQRTGTEVDSEQSNYCSLPEIKCEHKGRPRCYDDGNFRLMNFRECVYKGEERK